MSTITEPETAFPVMAQNSQAVRAFLAMQTQWMSIALSTMSTARIIRTGLKYEVLETVCRLREIALGEQDFVRVQVMEGAALKAWAEDART